MDIISFLKNLLPRFGKDRLVEDARITESEIETTVLPAYADAEKSLMRHKFKSKQIVDLYEVLQRNIKIKSSDNIVSVVLDAMEKVLKNHKMLQSKIEDGFEDHVIIEGITVVRLTMIRLLEFNSFLSRFSLKLLNYVYILETAEVSGEENYVGKQLSPGEIKWIEDNFLNFVLILKICSKMEGNFQETLESIPDINLSENPDAIVSAIGENRLDPFGTKMLVGFSGSPIYHIGLLVAEYQANRYKEKKELKTVLELRLLNLSRTLDKKPDASIEKQIQYVQGRIDRIDEYLREAEGNK